MSCYYGLNNCHNKYSSETSVSRRRFLALGIMLTFLISLSAGCLPNSNKSHESSDTIAREETIVLAHNQNRRVLFETIRNSADRFEADNPGYKVEIEVYVNEAYKKKLASAAATGNLPDVFATWSGSTLNEFSRLNMVIDLTELTQQYNDKERFIPSSLAQASDENGIWGIPVENITAALMFYNTEIFDELELSPPADWDEFLEIISTLKNNDYIPIALANRAAWTGSIYYMYLVDRIGGSDLFTQASNRSLPQGFAAPQFVEAWSYFQQLVELGAFPVDTNTLDEDVGDSKQLMYDNKAAMTLNGTWLISDIFDEQPDFLEKLDFFPFPAIEGGQGHPDNIVGTMGDQFYSISSEYNNPEKAYELIRYLLDDTAVEERLAAYVIPPLISVKPEDPMLSRILELAQKAPHIQFWYDQSLPPRLAEEHKQICRDVVEGLDPLEAAIRMEDAASEYD